MGLTEFQAPLLALIQALPADRLSEAIAADPLPAFWERAVDIYGQSGSWRGSEANFQDFILPFTGRLSRGQSDSLLDAIRGNGQNWDAAETDAMLLALLKNTPTEGWPTQGARDAFLEDMRSHRRMDKYEEVIELLKTDGWNPAGGT